ncbi:hypothetical protein ACH518_09995 [Methylomonas sp. HW2-6]|uniref:hypothetical protein n=1 Tax=Methylomonas sp. HW2-6 TaxID=3376687 RepID=UPI004041D21D
MLTILSEISLGLHAAAGEGQVGEPPRLLAICVNSSKLCGKFYWRPAAIAPAGSYYTRFRLLEIGSNTLLASAG